MQRIPLHRLLQTFPYSVICIQAAIRGSEKQAGQQRIKNGVVRLLAGCRRAWQKMEMKVATQGKTPRSTYINMFSSMLLVLFNIVDSIIATISSSFVPFL